MEEIHYIGNVTNRNEVQEYVNNYIIKKNEEKIKFLKIKIGKMQFGIFIIEAERENVETKIIKTENKIKFGTIKIEGKEYKFNTDIYFVINYPKGKDYEFVVENLLEKIIKDMESYEGI